MATVAKMPNRVIVDPRVGYDGQSQSLGHWDTEYHPDLKTFEKRVDRFDEVSTGDASVVAALEKLWWPVARATWVMDAQGKDDRSKTAAELMRANILRAGAPDASAYRMKTTWRQFLWETFIAERFGVSIYAIKYFFKKQKRLTNDVA